MQLVEIAPSQRLRPAGWLLALAPLAFVGGIVLPMTALTDAGVTDSADLTPAMMASIQTQWRAIAVIYAIAIILGRGHHPRPRRRARPTTHLT